MSEDYPTPELREELEKRLARTKEMWNQDFLREVEYRTEVSRELMLKQIAEVSSSDVSHVRMQRWLRRILGEKP